MTLGVRVEAVDWSTVANRLERGDTAVVAIGAAAKEHGWHLPMATDYLQAEALVDQLIAELTLVAWPTLSYGYYPVFVDYPGSISLREEVFQALVSDVIDGIFHAGATRLALLNTGISTIRPLQALLATHRHRVATRLINIYSGPRVSQARERHLQQAFGGHADEFETSILLALAPECVHLTRAVPQAIHIERGVFNRHDPQAPNYTPSGVTGDPTLANATKGAAFWEAIYKDVRETLEQAW